MGRRTKLTAARLDEGDEAEHEPKSAAPLVGSGDDDDEEANEDLSLKIVEKALSARAAKLASTSPGVGVSEEDGDRAAGGAVVVLRENDVIKEEEKAEKAQKKERRKKKSKGRENRELTIIDVDEEEKEEVVNVTEVLESVDPKKVEIADNIILRKLLRGPRYFDPPDSSWGTCYNCGVEGHTAVNCTSQKRRRPCFVCGSLEHNAKQCTKAQDCFICKKSGHRAKDCPEKQKAGSQTTKICLRCGHSGHDMFSCRSSYSAADLKEIQCYICKEFGHLCCVDSVDTDPCEVSCYKCGRLGHTGLACSKVRFDSMGDSTPSSCYKCGQEGHFARECRNSTRGEVTPSLCYKCGEGGHFARECRNSTTYEAAPSTCYKCGRDGHFARECNNSTKERKRNRDLSTPNMRFQREDDDYMGFDSAPNINQNSGKKKKFKHEDRGLRTPPQSKRRGGWITEDPEDIPPSKFTKSPRSPATPSRKGHISGSKSSNKSHVVQYGSYCSSRFQGSGQRSSVYNGSYGNSRSQGSGQRFSASRFGNSRYDGNRRNYDWW